METTWRPEGEARETFSEIIPKLTWHSIDFLLDRIRTLCLCTLQLRIGKINLFFIVKALYCWPSRNVTADLSVCERFTLAIPMLAVSSREAMTV